MSPNSLNSTQISICNLHMGTWVLHIFTTTRLSFVHNGTEYAQIAKVQATANCKFVCKIFKQYNIWFQLLFRLLQKANKAFSHASAKYTVFCFCLI